MTDAERYAVTVRKVRIEDEELWRATVRELPDLAEFAETREEAMDLALDAIESLKASAAEEGRPFPEPLEDEEEYSGRVTLRMSKSLHRAAALRAMSEEVSLNSFIVECVGLRTGSDFIVQSSDENSLEFAHLGQVQTANVGTGAFDWSKIIGIGNVTIGAIGTAVVSSSAQLSDIDTQFAIDMPAFPWILKNEDHIPERRRRS
jgi:predicted HicB family RNase H-like nuclease